MSILERKTCELNGLDVEVYYQRKQGQNGDYSSPHYPSETVISIVELDGVEIGTSQIEDEYLIEQILN